jgi:hypothetical protein
MSSHARVRNNETSSPLSTPLKRSNKAPVRLARQQGELVFPGTSSDDTALLEWDVDQRDLICFYMITFLNNGKMNVSERTGTRMFFRQL